MNIALQTHAVKLVMKNLAIVEASDKPRASISNKNIIIHADQRTEDKEDTSS